MSITVVKNKGVTVVTVTSDTKSMFPPLCQILKSLCYSPMCCSVYKGMMQTSVTAALGTMQIMVGLFNIGLGPGRTSLHPDDFSHLGVAYWLGGVFLVAGILSLLAGLFPSRCLVGFAVFMNIVGSIFSIVGIVMYGIDMGDFNTSSARLCNNDRHKGDNNCKNVVRFFQRLVTGMDVTMIILAALQLCVCISFAVLGIKALVNSKNKEDVTDVEIHQPELKEVLLTSPGA